MAEDGVPLPVKAPEVNPPVMLRDDDLSVDTSPEQLLELGLEKFQPLPHVLEPPIEPRPKRTRRVRCPAHPELGVAVDTPRVSPGVRGRGAWYAGIRCRRTSSSSPASRQRLWASLAG